MRVGCSWERTRRNNLERVQLLLHVPRFPLISKCVRDSSYRSMSQHKFPKTSRVRFNVREAFPESDITLLSWRVEETEEEREGSGIWGWRTRLLLSRYGHLYRCRRPEIDRTWTLLLKHLVLVLMFKIAICILSFAQLLHTNEACKSHASRR
jgi:hypothetical protein